MSRNGDLLWVPLKRASDIDVSKPLKTLIQSTYSNAEVPAAIQDKLKEFQKLRQNAVRATDKSEASANAIAK